MITNSMERQWWEFVLEHLSGGIRDSVVEAREQLLPASPEVSPLWRTTQDTPSQCPAMIWVCRWLFLGITSALLYGPLIWLHEIIFLKYRVRKDEKALMVYRFWNIKKVRKYSPSVGFCGPQGGGGTLVRFGRLLVIHWLLAKLSTALPRGLPQSPEGSCQLLEAWFSFLNAYLLWSRIN